AAELRDMVDLREDWASIGEGDLGRVESSTFEDWVKAPALGFPVYAHALAIALPICLVVLSVLVGLGVFTYHWPLAIAFLIGLEAILAASLLTRTRLAAANIVLPSFELGVIAPLLDRLQKEQFQSPLLKSLQAPLTHLSGSPSKQ